MSASSNHGGSGINKHAIAIDKANNFAMKTNPGLRATTNRAIIQELGSQMQLKAQKMKLLQRTDFGDDHICINVVEDGGARETKSSAPAGIISPKSPASSRLPVLSSRQRRRDAQAQQKVTKHRRNVVQDYRPGYTWNMGGRVKELKIRSIARKFLHLWKTKTFGRVLPSVARQHRRHHVMKQAFNVWLDMWWEIRKEWGLGIRADLHNRYRLWTKAWHAWREYTLISRVQTIQRKIAEHHADSRLCSAVLQGWHVYVDMRRTKNVLYQKATQVYCSNLVSQAWCRWQQQHDLANARKCQEVAALQHWAHNLMANFWQTWRSKFLEKQQGRDKHCMAVEHHNKSMIRVCYQAWCVYVIHRRHKHGDSAQAVAHYRQHQMRYYLGLWTGRLQVLMQIYEHHAQIELLAQRSLCRRVVVHWKFYIQLVHESHKNNIVAAEHHRKQLLQTAMSAWKLFIIKQRNKRLQQYLSVQFYYKTLIKRSWLRWLERCEEKEDLKLICQSRRAYRHHHTVILNKAWRAWLKYITWRRLHNRQLITADAHYITQALPRYMERWQHYTQITKTNREMVAAAADFRRENLLAQFFYEWHRQYEGSQDTRLAERMAVLHNEENNKRRLFTLWWRKTQDALEENFKMSVASEHCEKILCLRLLRQWKGIITDKKKMIADTHTALKHWYIHLMHKVIRGWRQNTIRKLHKMERKTNADIHHHRKIMRLTFTRWQHYHGWWREVNVYVEGKVNEKNQELLRQMLYQWHHNVQEQKLESEKFSMAVAQHNTVLLQNVMVKWHHYAVLRAHKKQKTQEIVCRAQTVLKKGKLQRYLEYWRRAKDSAASLRHKEERAEAHYERVTMVQAWRGWREMVKLNHRKQLLMRQAMWMHNTRITANYFLCWKSAYAEAQQVNNKTNLALWHWCVHLQHKVLHAWMSYAAERRRKAQRTSEALESHRLRLLRTGTTQWIRVASDMAEMRQKFAQQRGAQNYYRIHQVVLRCASHWRHLVAKHKVERGGVPARIEQPIRSQKQASSVTLRPADILPLTAPFSKRVLQPSLCASPLRGATGTLGAVDLPPQRAAPRKPSFLLESLKREGLYSSLENSHLCRGDGSNISVPRSEHDKVLVAPTGHEGEQQWQTNAVRSLIPSESSREQSNSQPFAAYRTAEDQGEFVGMETSTSLGTQVKSLQTTGNTTVTIGDISSFPVESMDLLPTSKTGQFETSHLKNSAATCITKTKDNKSSTEGQSSYLCDLENDLEPRPPPLPSLEHSEEANFERSDDLNISVSVVDGGQSDPVTNGARNKLEKPIWPKTEIGPQVGLQKLYVSAKSDGTQSEIPLLPPMAFMFYSDGTLISDTEQNTTLSESHQHAPLGSDEQLIDPVAVTTASFSNPAEELVDIRKRLKQFQAWKKQLKNSSRIHKQLKSWVEEQQSQTTVRADTDPDVKQARDEIQSLEDEIETLNEQIAEEKPNIHRLTERVQQILHMVTS